MQNADQEYLRAFRGEEPTVDEDVAPDESAPEGVDESDAASVVVDANEAVDAAAESKGLPTEEEAAAAAEQVAAQSEEAPQGEGDVLAEAAAEGEPVEQEMAEERSPEDIQREKSWEGRLRKKEEELAAREAAMSAEPKLAEGGDVNDAEIEEIRAKLAEDFGPEFVSMIDKLACHAAKKFAGSDLDGRVNPINARIDEAIAEVTEAFNKMHFGAIADAYEDFQEIIASPEFQMYVDALPEGTKESALSVLENGTSGQVVRLLKQFKDHLDAATSKEEPAAGDDPALEAAEGVRGSAPVSLPVRSPVGEEDEYKSAWSQM